jgi:hypothetical protein
MRYWIASSLLLLGCSQPALTSEHRGEQAAPSEGLDAVIDDDVTKVMGHFELWQNDRGDDAQMCNVEFLGSRAIGGYRINADERCLHKIGIEDISAWFVTDSGETLVLIDATRKVVMRLQRGENGYYYFGNNEFYLSKAF